MAKLHLALRGIAKPTSQRCGFSLVELLVVVAIIAIAAGLLFPVFAQAKKHALDPVCASQMRQLYMGVELYMESNNEGNPMSLLNIKPYVKDEHLFLCRLDPIHTPLPDGFPAQLFVPSDERSPFRISYGFLGAVPGYDTPTAWANLINRPEVGMLADPWHGKLVFERMDPTMYLTFGPLQEGPNLRINMDGSLYRLAKDRLEGYHGDTRDLYLFR